MTLQQAGSTPGRSGSVPRLLRCGLLLLGCAAATVVLLGLAAEPLRDLAAAGPASMLRLPLDRLVAGGCALALVACWLWLVAGVVSVVLTVAAEGARRPLPRLLDRLGPRWVRLLALAAVGVAVGAGPATAAGAGGERATPPSVTVAGLPVPDRTVSPVADRPESPAPAPRLVQVRPGDSLWQIASRLAPGGTSPAELDLAWRRLAEANRDVIGPDPDLIFPGTALAVPEHLFGKDIP